MSVAGTISQCTECGGVILNYIPSKTNFEFASTDLTTIPLLYCFVIVLLYGAHALLLRGNE